MKRTPIERRTPLRAKAPMSRRREKRATPQAKRKVSTNNRWRSPIYLAFVRSLPCSACGITPCDAHHVVGIYGVGGMGLKAEDSMAMPLCRACHMELHREPGWLQHQPRWLRHTIELGMQEFDGEIYEALREALAFINEKESVK